MPDRAGCCRSGNGRCHSTAACPRNAAPAARFRTRPLVNPSCTLAPKVVFLFSTTMQQARRVLIKRAWGVQLSQDLPTTPIASRAGNSTRPARSPGAGKRHLAARDGAGRLATSGRRPLLRRRQPISGALTAGIGSTDPNVHGAAGPAHQSFRTFADCISIQRIFAEKKPAYAINSYIANDQKASAGIGPGRLRR